MRSETSGVSGERLAVWVLPVVAGLIATGPGAVRAAGVDGLVLDVEVGPGFVLRNDCAFGEQGTRYSAEDVNQDATLFRAQRLALEARLGARHGVALTYAPLTLVSDAVLPLEVRFNDVVFARDTPVRNTYVFDGYRATYVYRVKDGAELSWDLGVSLQIRSARVQMESRDGELLAEQPDIGPVPALDARLLWQPSPDLWVALQGTGLSRFNGKGSLYDVALTLGFPLGRERDVSAFLRLRAYGGGADVEDPWVYTFADFAFALVGVRADLAALLR